MKSANSSIFMLGNNGGGVSLETTGVIIAALFGAAVAAGCGFFLWQNRGSIANACSSACTWLTSCCPGASGSRGASRPLLSHT